MKNNKLVLCTIVGAIILSWAFGLNILLTQTVSAAANDGLIHNPLGNTSTLSQVLTMVISTVQVIAGIISVVYIILAGLKFVTAGGNEKKITDARTMILYVVIGVAIIFGAQAISTVVQATIKQVGSGQ